MTLFEVLNTEPFSSPLTRNYLCMHTEQNIMIIFPSTLLPLIYIFFVTSTDLFKESSFFFTHCTLSACFVESELWKFFLRATQLRCVYPVLLNDAVLHAAGWRLPRDAKAGAVAELHCCHCNSSGRGTGDCERQHMSTINLKGKSQIAEGNGSGDMQNPSTET